MKKLFKNCVYAVRDHWPCSVSTRDHIRVIAVAVFVNKHDVLKNGSKKNQDSRSLRLHRDMRKI